MGKNEKWKVGKNEKWKVGKNENWKNWKVEKFGKIGLSRKLDKIHKIENRIIAKLDKIKKSPKCNWVIEVIRTVFWHAHVTLEKQNEKRHLCFCLPAWLHFVPLLASWGLLRLWFSRSWPDWFPWWHRHAVSSPKFKVFFF